MDFIAEVIFWAIGGLAAALMVSLIALFVTVAVIALIVLRRKKD